MLIEVREPTHDVVGCVSARASEFGPEICYAAGSEHGSWYMSVCPAAFDAADIESGRLLVAGGREDAERLVRLLAALYAKGACLNL